MSDFFVITEHVKLMTCPTSGVETSNEVGVTVKPGTCYGLSFEPKSDGSPNSPGPQNVALSGKKSFLRALS